MSQQSMEEPFGTPTDRMHWDDFLTDRDKKFLYEAEWGKSQPFGLGDKPAVIVIDDYYGALGHTREPILESVKTWPMSCGLDGWKAIDRTVDLLAAAREHDVPIIYINLVEEIIASLKTRSGPRAKQWEEMPAELRAMANRIVDEIAPQEGDLVLQKGTPSAFTGTPLPFHLNALGIDTVILCGESTSGCVRASAVDASTYRFKLGVVGECCFDRTQASHHMSLFDLDQKYGDVMSVDEVRKYFEQL